MSTWKEIIEILPAKKVILPDNDPKKPYYNPSLVRYQHKLLISIRSSTWTLGEGGNGATVIGGKLHTDVLLGEVDKKTLTVKELKKLEYSGNVHPYVQNIGLEDVRLFVRDDELHAIGVCMSKEDRRGETVHIAEGIIKGDKLEFKELVPKPFPERVEKNWTVPEVPSRFFDYIYSPTQVITDGILLGEHEYHGLLHGGSQAIRWEDGWLSFMHRVHRTAYSDQRGFRQYTSHAIKYDAQGFATEISQGFLLFGDNQVEFIAGLVKSNDGQLLVSMGLGDAHAVIAKINPNHLHFQHYSWSQEPIRAVFPPNINHELAGQLP